LHKYSVQESLNLMMNTGEDALKVDIDNVTLITEGSDVNIEVHIDQAEDSILAYGYDGSSNQKIKTDASGNVQVDIVSGGATATEYSEDAATPSTISGIGVMMERDDALSSLTPAEGDWVALRSSAEGALWTQEFNSDAILADTASMDTNLGTVAGAVSSGQMQVDVVASIPAGDNNIGNVDIVTLPASTNTIEIVGDAAENAAVAGNPVLIGGRYDSSARTLGDGDVGAIALDADGAVHIADGGNALTIDGTVTANLSATDNAVLDSILTKNTEIDAVLDTIDADTGAIKTAVEIIDNAISGSEMQVDVVTMPSVTVDSEFPAAATAADNFSNPSTTNVMSMGMVYDGSAWDRMLGDSTNGALVNLGSNNDVTVSGTVTANLSATDNAVLDAMVVDLAALETLQTSTNTKLDTLETTLTAIETDQAAIEVLLTAANVDHAANEVLLGTIDADTNAIKTAVEIIDNAISGSEMQVDTVSTVQPAGFGSIGHGNNTDVSSSTAEAIAGSQACKHIDVMAAIANTGIIYVGGSGVTAATGIGLYAGDVYSVDIDNVNDVYVVASVNGEDVQYVYYS